MSLAVTKNSSKVASKVITAVMDAFVAGWFDCSATTHIDEPVNAEVVLVRQWHVADQGEVASGRHDLGAVAHVAGPAGAIFRDL